MTTLNPSKKEDKEITKYIKELLEKEGFEGAFKISEDPEIKNGYIIFVKTKLKNGIRTIKQRAYKAIELEEKARKRFPNKYFSFTIFPE